MIASLVRSPALRTLVAFGSVGIAATAVHFAVGLSLVNSGTATPFMANILAFLCAYLCSYVGHHRFTFRSNAAHSRALPRFFAVAVLGLVLNQVIVYVCVNLVGWSYLVALVIVVSLVPAIIFVAGKFWAFK